MSQVNKVKFCFIQSEQAQELVKSLYFGKEGDFERLLLPFKKNVKSGELVVCFSNHSSFQPSVDIYYGPGNHCHTGRKQGNIWLPPNVQLLTSVPYEVEEFMNLADYSEQAILLFS